MSGASPSTASVSFACLEEGHAGEADADVDAGRELLADRTERQRRRRFRVGKILLDDEHSAAKAAIGGQVIGERRADDGPAGDHRIEPVRHSNSPTPTVAICVLC